MILKDAHQMIEMLSSHFNYWIIYCVCVCVCVYLDNDRKFGTMTGYNPQIKNVEYTTHRVSLFWSSHLIDEYTPRQ